MSWAFVLLAAAVAWPFGVAEDLDRLGRFAGAAGSVVLAHIGWAFGAYIPVLLGFYVIVLGGQIVGPRDRADKVRRNLGYVSELLVAALVPALVLIVPACVEDPSQTGALLVIVPVAAMMFFLAVRLGQLNAYDTEELLSSARRSLATVRGRLDDLRQHSSQKPIWLLLSAYGILGSLIGGGITFLFARPVAAAFLLYFAAALVLGYASLYAVYMADVTQDRMGKFVAWTLPVAMYALALGGTALTFDVSVPAAVGFLLVVLISALSMLWPRRRASRFMLDWTLRGGGARWAVKSLDSTQRRTEKEIRELVAEKLIAEITGEVQPPPLRERVRDALRVVRGGRGDVGPRRGSGSR